MFRPLSSIVPNVADLLALEVEELAGVLLVHLNGFEDSVKHQGGISHYNFFNAPERQDYESRQFSSGTALAVDMNLAC